MFLEKYSRFFRTYDLRITSLILKAEVLPLDDGSKNHSVRAVLQKAIDDDQASEVQPNDDIVELVEATYRKADKALVLLFHRASPNAADPMYRKREKGKLTTRQIVKAKGEEQSVSAHLVVRDMQSKKGVYRAALEEIPGIGMSSIQSMIGKILRDYRYAVKDDKQKRDTYSVFKPEGVKSETLTKALKTGNLNMVTLSREAPCDLPDADGLLEPQRQYVKLRVVGSITSNTWRDQLPEFARKVREDGWDDISVDMEFDDKRRRTVKIDRDEEAKEILFVRSEQAHFIKVLEPCSATIQDETVNNALKIIKRSKN